MSPSDRNSPAAPLFAVACAGALFGLTVQSPSWPGAVLGILSLVVVVRLRAGAQAPMLRAGALLAAGFFLTAALAAQRRANHESTVKNLPEETVFEGVVLEDAPSAANGRNLLLEVSGVLPGPGHEIARAAAYGRVKVGLRGAAAAFTGSAGDRIRVLGRLKRLRPADRPGTFDAKMFGLARSLHGRLNVYDPRRLLIVEENVGGGFWSQTRDRLRQRLFSLTTPREAGVVLALLVGDTSTFDEEQHHIYRAVGAGHLLAVSGLQVTLLAVLLFGLFRILFGLLPTLGRRSRTRAPAAALALAGVWAFVLLCGAPPSCVRAGAMATAGLGALVLDRQAAGLDALGLAGLVTVILAPQSVIDPSFLLSYAAVIGLLLASGETSTDLLVRKSRFGRVPEQAGAVVLGAAGAGFLTLPISAHLFGEISIGGIVANIVLVPAAATLQVPALSLGLIGAWLNSSFLVELGAACAGLLEALCEGLGAIMGGLVEVRAPAGVATMMLTLAVASLIVAVAKKNRLLAAGGLLAIGTTLATVVWTPAGVRITVLPVGQGDGAVVEFEEGTIMVIDGGGVWDEHRDPGEEVVTPHLRRRGIKKVDIVALSHPDPDHLLGLLTVFAQHEVGELWISGHGAEHPLMARLLAAAKAQGTRVRNAVSLHGSHSFGDAIVEVLAPFPEDGGAIYPELSPNDNSLVLRIGLGDTHALWPGDIEEWGETFLLRDRPDLSADVLKAPHHGSRTSSTPAFIKAVGAKHVVFPTGRENQWGFPHAEVVERYLTSGAELWDTARHGEIDLWLTRSGVVVDPFLQVAPRGSRR